MLMGIVWTSEGGRPRGQEVSRMVASLYGDQGVICSVSGATDARDLAFCLSGIHDNKLFPLASVGTRMYVWRVKRCTLIAAQQGQALERGGQKRKCITVCNPLEQTTASLIMSHLDEISISYATLGRGRDPGPMNRGQHRPPF